MVALEDVREGIDVVLFVGMATVVMTPIVVGGVVIAYVVMAASGVGVVTSTAGGSAVNVVVASLDTLTRPTLVGGVMGRRGGGEVNGM